MRCSLWETICSGRSARRSSGGSRNEGKSVVFVSHQMAPVEKFCDRVAIFNDGGLREKEKRRR